MFKRRKRRWHAQNDSPGCGPMTGGMAAMLAIYVPALLALIPLFRWHPLLAGVAWLAAILTAAGVMVRIINGSLRLGIWTDDRGLTERFWPWRRRRLSWAEITDVVASDERAVLHHNGGQVELAPPLADWAQIAATAQARLGLTPTPVADDEVRALPPEEVAAWLGIDRDGELVGASGFHRRLRWWVGGIVGLYVLLMATQYAGLGVLVELIGLILLFATGVPGVLNRHYQGHRRVDQVRATPDYLEAHSRAGWTRFAWGGLKSLRRVGLFWVVTSTEGDLWLPPKLGGLDRLLHAIREAIAAREQGFVLPRMTGDVSQAALSPAEVAVADERGLSAAEQPPE